jgi:ABC-type dipeptide/oligopeptide/nickel transport system permease subunit
MTRSRPSNQRIGQRSPLLVVGVTVLAALAIVALFAPVLSPYDPRELSGDSLERPSGRHLLGTNDIGQDILSQVIWGTRASLEVAVGAASLVVALGALLGVVPALLGGMVDRVATRMAVVFLALPALPLLILVGALAGPSRLVVILVIGIIGWPTVARLLRSQTLTLRSRGFIAASRGFGSGPLYVCRRHLLPALAPFLVVSFVTWSGLAIGIEAALAFLGLGDPTGVSWGLMLNRALETQGIYYSGLWTWWVLPAGFAITVAVLGFTFVGVGLEPRFNRRVQG